MRALYKGLLRVLLALLHDFPTVLATHHIALCTHIPTRCFQMRNLVLSAFPKDMKLMDPFEPSLKLDHIPEMKQARPRALVLALPPCRARTIERALSVCQARVLELRSSFGHESHAVCQRTPDKSLARPPSPHASA